MEEIAVLGAGPMGLAVAYELCQQGHRPIVFEADDRIGGMSASFDFDGLSIERYYHFHCLSDHALLQILDELGIADSLHWVETKMAYWYQNRLQKWGDPMALLSFRGLSLMPKLRYALHAFLAIQRNEWQSLDTLEATAWIRRWVGKEAYEVLWQKLFDYKFYDDASSLSAAWIWSRIRRIGRSRANLFHEKLGFLEGGSDTLLKALQGAIEQHGGQIFLRSPIHQVAIKNAQVQGVIVNDKLQPFSKVISTVPLPFVPRLMPDLPDEILAQFKARKNIAVVCVIVKLRRALSPYFWMNINDPEMDIPGLVEYSNLNPLDCSIVYIPFYLPSEHPKFSEPDTVFLAKVKRYLQKINPTLTDHDFIALQANRYRFAQPICPPRFLDTLPPCALPIQGLWVADTSYYYPEDRGIAESIAFGRNMARQACA